MTSEDACPHCGSDDFERVGPDLPRLCLTCGYDDEHGTLAVCPGGKHPLDQRRRGRLVCDPCWNSVPRDLPGYPRWRSHHRNAKARNDQWTMLGIETALVKWLAENPVAMSPRDAKAV